MTTMVLEDTKKKCIGFNKDGSKCNAYSLSDSDYCLFHDPNLQEVREEARKFGGRKRQYVKIGSENIELVESYEDILNGLSEVIANLKSMDNTVSANRALIDAYRAVKDVIEDSELVERLEELEEAIYEKIN